MTSPRPYPNAPTFPTGGVGGGGSTTPTNPNRNKTNSTVPGAVPFTGPVADESIRPWVDPSVPGRKFTDSFVPSVVTKETDSPLYDILDLPGSGNEAFTMEINDNTKVTAQYTMRAGVEWLRDLSIRNKPMYNYIVSQLYQAQYLAKSDVSINSFTSQVAQAFIEAAYDTYAINEDEQGGAVTTLFDHLDELIAGYQELGIGPDDDLNGDGSGAEPPVRQDSIVDEDTLKDTVRTASRNALGRALNDDEEAAFVSAFRAKEKEFNDSSWNATLGNAGTFVSRPQPTTTADEYVRNQFGQEKAGQDMGSYMGVLRNMMGLGAGGIGID